MTAGGRASLALCFDAPMQSWGVRSRGIIRETTAEPTKSGVVGLLAAALGVERDDTTGIGELAGLRLGVRVDREGLVERDYHTTQNVPTTTGGGHRTVVSERYYLADALFLVVLEGHERLLTRVADAVRAPHWRLCFGRKAYVPARPLLAPGGGPGTESIEDVFTHHAWLEKSSAEHARAGRDNRMLRTVVECAPDDRRAETRYDQPISFAPNNRRFAPRTVAVDEIPLTRTMIEAAKQPCI